MAPEPELGDPERWRTIVESEEARANLFAELCDEFDPKRPEPYRTRAYRVTKDMPGRPDLGAPDMEWIRWHAEKVRAQADYLERRFERLRGRVEFRARLADDGRRGLERFAPGLDADLDVVRDQIRRVGGLTYEHRVELGRIGKEDAPSP